MTALTAWPTARLEDLLLSKRDLTYGIVKPGTATTDGVPIVRVRDVRNDAVNTSEPLRVAATVEAAYERSRLRGGELLVTLVGTVGETAVAGPELAGWNVARAIAVARVRPDVGARWVTWAMKLSASAGLIAERVNTTVQTTLNLADLRDVPIPLPPQAQRDAIAATLGAIDDKIESNRRSQGIGQDLIRGIVDQLVVAEQPTGRLGDYCEIVKDQVKADALDPDSNYIGFEHMPRGSIFLNDWGTADGLGSHKSRFVEGDVLFGKLRPYFKKVGVAPVAGVCSTDILVVRPKEVFDTALVAIVASSDALIESVSAGATGTRMPRASWKDLASWPIPELSKADRAKLGNRVSPVLERLSRLTHESHTLESLRDMLLPELLSGRIHVAEAAT